MDKRIAKIQQNLLDIPQNVKGVSSLKPDLYPSEPNLKKPIDAAVLITLVRKETDYSVLYTKRSTDLRAHSGQIAFPGGKIDEQDENAAAAALREANEEVAMNSDDVQILGYLPTMFTGSNYLITPVVGVIEPSAPFVANPNEVEEIFEVPLAFLSKNNAYQSFMVTHGGKQQQTWKIEHENRIIWGITANLTRAFKDIALGGFLHD